MILIVLWLAFALVVAIAANTRGRNGLVWFLIATVISPLFGILLLLAFPNQGADRTVRVSDAALMRNIEGGSLRHAPFRTAIRGALALIVIGLIAMAYSQRENKVTEGTVQTAPR